MSAKKEASAVLYLENVEVMDMLQAQFGWRVRVKLEREGRTGTITRWYTLWFREKPEIEVGWLINASGYMRTRGSVGDDGQVRVGVELSSARLQSASPPASTDPWGDSGANEGTW